VARKTIQRHFLPAVPSAASPFSPASRTPSPAFTMADLRVHDDRSSRSRWPDLRVHDDRSGRSRWPDFRVHDGPKFAIEKLFPDKSQAGYDSGSPEWGRYRIQSSVMADDFARYVIGTNSAATSRNWLSLRLGDPEWTPPPRPDELLSALVAEFSMTERAALDGFDSVDKAYSAIPLTMIIGSPRKRSRRASAAATAPNPKITTIRLEKKRISGLAELKRKREEALQGLRSALETTHRQRFDDILALASMHVSRQPPRFPLEQIQRYILRRALELGWTADRFGLFDRSDIGYDGGRSAAKAERIGKKYQWIAYHEMLAFISDHFQHRDDFRDDKGLVPTMVPGRMTSGRSIPHAPFDRSWAKPGCVVTRSLGGARNVTTAGSVPRNLRNG